MAVTKILDLPDYGTQDNAVKKNSSPMKVKHWNTLVTYQATSLCLSLERHYAGSNVRSKKARTMEATSEWTNQMISKAGQMGKKHSSR